MRKRAYGGNIVNARVDWITATAQLTSSRERLWALGQRSLSEVLEEGESLSTWKGHGYRGWFDTGISIGDRPDSTLLRLSGSHAGDKWREAVAACDNVSRLDLAVDCEFEPPEVAVSRQTYREVNHGPARNGRPPKRSLIISSDGGSTCYVGSRASEYFGRVYDKGVEQESHLPGCLWRWELEVKGKSAVHTAEELVLAEDETSRIISNTLDWFSMRGARVPSYTFTGACTTGPRPLRTIEKRIEWLARSVRPTVMSVADVRGSTAVASLLGLSR